MVLIFQKRTDGFGYHINTRKIYTKKQHDIQHVSLSFLFVINTVITHVLVEFQWQKNFNVRLQSNIVSIQMRHFLQEYYDR